MANDLEAYENKRKKAKDLEANSHPDGIRHQLGESNTIILTRLFQIPQKRIVQANIHLGRDIVGLSQLWKMHTQTWVPWGLNRIQTTKGYNNPILLRSQSVHHKEQEMRSPKK